MVRRDKATLEPGARSLSELLVASPLGGVLVEGGYTFEPREGSMATFTVLANGPAADDRPDIWLVVLLNTGSAPLVGTLVTRARVSFALP